MLIRILKGVVYRNRGSFALTLVSAVVGAALVASLGSLALGIADKISAELKRYGANILVKPASSDALAEADLIAMKSSIFWRHNVVGITPYLYSEAVVVGPSGSAPALVSGTWFDRQIQRDPEFRTGLRSTSPFIEVEGEWPVDRDEPRCIIGSTLAERLSVRPGDFVIARLGSTDATLQVTGIMSSGGYEDEQLFVPLEHLQRLTGRPGVVSQALVSAVTVPLDDFGRRDPDSMTKTEFDKWYCTAYVTSVSKQIQEAVAGSTVRPIWQVVEAEGKVLSQLSWLVYALVGVTLVASSLAVSTTLMGNVMRRRTEIGLLKALGGEPRQVAVIFLFEAAAIGVVAGVLGWAVGWVLARYLGEAVFGSPFEFGARLLFISLAASLSVTVAGAWLPLREALSVPAGEVMRG